MSGTATRHVATCTHPRVRGAARRLFEVIADRVPEGHTTTPLIDLDELAAAAPLHRRTVISRLQVLVDIGEVQVIDGGQGRTGARYTLVHLDGERPPTVVPLPLRADLRAVPPPTTDVSIPDAIASVRQTTDEHPAKTITSWRVPVLVATSWRWLVLVITSCRRWAVLVATSRKTITSWIQLVATSTPVYPLGVASRARDVHTLQKEPVHTHGPPRDERPTVEDSKPPPAIVHPWHAWCGRVCVPKQLHQAWLQKDHAETWLFAFYARTCAATTAEQARAAVDEFKFWRAALAAEVASPPSRARAPTVSPPAKALPVPNVWTAVLARIEGKVNRHSFYTWFQPTSFVADHGASIAVCVPNVLFQDWLTKHYSGVIGEALADVGRPSVRITFVVEEHERQRQSG